MSCKGVGNYIPYCVQVQQKLCQVTLGLYRQHAYKLKPIKESMPASNYSKPK